MAAKVGRRLRKKGLAGRTLSLKLRFGDRSVRSVQKRLPAPSDDELAFTPLLYRMVYEVWCEGIPVRLLGVGMSGFREDEYVQDTLFDVAREAPTTHDAEPVIVDDVKRRGLLDAIRCFARPLWGRRRAVWARAAQRGEHDGYGC